jgi:fibronectin type 3 domain-containing protein
MKQPQMIRLGTRVADSRRSWVLFAIIGVLSISGCAGVASQNQSGVNLQVTAHSATLSWTEGPPVVGFRVYRSMQSGTSFTLLTSTLVPGTSFVDSTVAKGQTYFYVVTAVDAQSHESAFSNEVSATIPSS